MFMLLNCLSSLLRYLKFILIVNTVKLIDHLYVFILMTKIIKQCEMRELVILITALLLFEMIILRSEAIGVFA